MGEQKTREEWSVGSTEGVVRKEERLQLVFCCKVRVDPEDWFWGYRER